MVHGCVVYTERPETAAVSCGASHASAASSTPLGWIFIYLKKKKKNLYKKLFIYVESHASALSLLESGEERYTEAINNNNNDSPCKRPLHRVRSRHKSWRRSGVSRTPPGIWLGPTA